MLLTYSTFPTTSVRDCGLLVLSIIVTFWSFYSEILAEPYYCPKDGQFAKHCQTPHDNRS